MPRATSPTPTLHPRLPLSRALEELVSKSRSLVATPVDVSAIQADRVREATDAIEALVSRHAGSVGPTAAKVLDGVLKSSPEAKPGGLNAVVEKAQQCFVAALAARPAVPMVPDEEVRKVIETMDRLVATGEGGVGAAGAEGGRGRVVQEKWGT
ncbi:hypothetical protein HDU96_005004 [Phlyctochytrium bullatum]|nr:hypothetical protein HDU96_005004 [Phlyctochytrium bullatum]